MFTRIHNVIQQKLEPRPLYNSHKLAVKGMADLSGEKHPDYGERLFRHLELARKRHESFMHHVLKTDANT